METFIEGLILFAWGLFALVVKSVVVLTVLFVMLQLANKRLGIKMKDIVGEIRKDPQALSDYFGRRLIAAAIVIFGVSVGALTL